MTSFSVLGRLDSPLGSEGSMPLAPGGFKPGASPPTFATGAWATVNTSADGSVRISRDPLGIQKLYWAWDGEDLCFSSRPHRIVEAGIDLRHVLAVPPGATIDLNADLSVRRHEDVRPEGWPRRNDDDVPSSTLDESGTAIRAAMIDYLEGVSKTREWDQTFVLLSGGLDSTGMAALASEIFPDLVAVSFSLVDEAGNTSHDRDIGAKVARDLGLPLMEVDVRPEELLDHLDAVLIAGADWRDFNVHAGLVNAAMAEALSASLPAGQHHSLVITGDLANEFLVDYEPEVYRGKEYYVLPDLPRPRLQEILVRGLESTHREVGVLGQWGITVAQPYVAAVEHYLRLPATLLSNPNGKKILCERIFGSRIPSYVYERPKTRAQVGGGEGMGVLGACIDRGVDQPSLKHRFAELHGVPDFRELDRFIRAGRTRSGIPGDEKSS